jgi:methyl-accepting chemotaxis protein
VLIIKNNISNNTVQQKNIKDKLLNVANKNECIYTNLVLAESLLGSMSNVVLNDTRELINKVSSQDKSFINLINHMSDLSTSMNSYTGGKSIEDIISDINTKVKEYDSLNNEITKTIETSETKLTNMRNVTNNVKSIANNIERISDTFEILALNALIEAERSGKYGKGFSIVASKLKEITPELKESATNISQYFRKVFEEVIDLEDSYRTLIKKIHLDKTNQETKEIVDLLIMNYNKIEQCKNNLSSEFEINQLSVKDFYSNLQTEDIVSQQITHISDILREIEKNSNYLYEILYEIIDKADLNNYEIRINAIKNIFDCLTMESEREAIRKSSERKLGIKASTFETTKTTEKIINRTKEFMGEDLSDSITLF